MTNIYLLTYLFIGLALCIMACQPEDEDFTRIKAENEAVIAQLAHTWQIVEFRVTGQEIQDTTLINVGSLRFARCEITPQNLMGCDEGGVYQWQQSPEVTIGYGVSPSQQGLKLFIFVPKQDHAMEGVENLHDNWTVEKLDKDSLVLSSMGGYRSRTLKLARE